MGYFILAVLSNPVAGRESEFNSWYDDVHLADVLRLDGFKWAERFRLAPNQEDAERPYGFLALYGIETDDVGAVEKRLIEAAGTEAMPFSPALDLSDIKAWFFESIGERQTRPPN